MSKFQFVKYEPTPNEKHLGIATVIIEDTRIIAKFKIVTAKDGTTFAAPASFKMGEQWAESLTIDSKMDDSNLKSLIKEMVQKESGALPSICPVITNQPEPTGEYDNDLMF